MSKAVTIEKNGVEQELTLDKLRLPKQGGGTEDWIPADGKDLVNIVVKQNGTYKASDFGAYGIAQVKVACTLSGGSATSKAASKAIKVKHNPAPAEGGRARVMSAHHLVTALTAGGSCQWVPESEVALGTKYINVDNKTYKASDDGKYGWSEVVISGISITKDGDTITHTDGTGTVTYVLPTEIRVVNPPYKLRYADGEPIDFTGMVVKAYKSDGSLWTDSDHPNGVIPFEELTVSDTVADITKTHSQLYAWSDLDLSPLTGPIPIVYRVYEEYDYRPYWEFYTEFDGNKVVRACAHDPFPDINVLYATGETEPQTVRFYDANTGEPTGAYGIWNPEAKPHFTYDGKTVYYEKHGSLSNYDHYADFMNPVIDEFADNLGPMAWTMVFGTITGGSDIQSITVSWSRPYDFETLETSFDIHVGNFGGATGGGGQTSGGGAGRG